jgi:hypothetical protein
MAPPIKAVVLLASAVIGGLALFPPRVAVDQSATRVSRGFLFGDNQLAKVVLSDDGRGGQTVTHKPSRLDGTRFAIEVVFVISVAAAIGLCLIRPSGTKANTAP